jgi:hypothetical protein
MFGTYRFLKPSCCLQEKVRALEKQNAVLRQNRESRGEDAPTDRPAGFGTGKQSLN